jgi:hypothetical protein
VVEWKDSSSFTAAGSTETVKIEQVGIRIFIEELIIHLCLLVEIEIILQFLRLAGGAQVGRRLMRVKKSMFELERISSYSAAGRRCSREQRRMPRNAYRFNWID